MFSFLKSKRVENIIFLHLPKAGGTTLRHIFYNQYGYLNKDEVFTINRTKETHKFLDLPIEKKNKIKVLVGHFAFGLDNYMKGEFKYVTFMRDPIDRAISAYFYNKGHSDSDVFNAINSENLSLDEYLDKNIEPWSNNAMTKHFAGCTLEEFKGECTKEMYEKAVYNLQNSCIAVGLTERFDDSLKILQKKLKWGKLEYENKNITPKRKEVSEIKKSTLEKIGELNQYDILFYELGKEMFEKDFKVLGQK